MAKQMDITKYMSAIDLVKRMSAKPIGKEVPIKVTHFCKDHKLDVRFFRILKELKIITPEIGEPKEGTIFSWTHKEASNESNSFLATRVTNEIYKLNQAGYIKVSDPKYKTKKAKKDWKEEERKRKQEETLKKSRQKGLTETIMIATPAPVAVEEFTLQHSSFSFGLSGTLSKKELLSKMEALINDMEITKFSIEVQY